MIQPQKKEVKLLFQTVRKAEWLSEGKTETVDKSGLSPPNG
jgi:hypothetical protein